MIEPNFHVITGASGAGKSTLIKALGDRGCHVVPEVALALMQEQAQSGGDLLPATRREAFMREVLARNVQAYEAARSLDGPVFFDRAVPECLAHMKLLGIDIGAEGRALLQQHRYANNVFVAAPWAEIYVCDAWRTAPFERAQQSYAATMGAYVQEGYEVRLLPRASVEERVAFVLSQIGAVA